MMTKLETLRRLWNEWQLIGSIFLSLLLQIILVLSANVRKRNSYKVITIILWLAYLCADWVAIFSLGIISNSLGDVPFHSTDILAFWSPFLLLHLGGPDTITAFSLEDNQLWSRHALGLILQLIAVIYIFIRSLKGSKLLLPTLCMFLAGFVKYGERTWSLKCSSMDGLRGSMVARGDPGPNYLKILDTFLSELNAGNPAKINALKESEASPSFNSSIDIGISTRPHDPVAILTEAYHFFLNFKRLFVDLILSFQDRNQSLSFFSTISSSEAYKVIEIELNFAYDVLYTKALVVHTRHGRIVRAITFCLTIIASFIFFVVQQSHPHTNNRRYMVDIIITYILILGALILDLIGLGSLIISDWTIVQLRNSKHYPKLLESGVFQILTKLNSSSKPRWSNLMGQYSLLSYCIQDQPSVYLKFVDLFKVKDIVDQFRYTKYVNVFEELKSVIFEDLKERSTLPEHSNEYKSLISCRGQRALGRDDIFSELNWSVEVEFDESLLLWHIATDICYHLHDETVSPQFAHHRDISKVISHYMLYLLIVCPFMLSSTAGLGVIRYQDTCAEAIEFFEKEELMGCPTKRFMGRKAGVAPEKLKESEVCEVLMFIHTVVAPKEVKGDRSLSVWWDGVKLAKELRALDEEKMWKVMCNVWIEMLCFAARHCRGNHHAEMLSAGGELLTFVWLLEAHLGMGDYFQIKSGHVTTNVVLENYFVATTR